MVEQILLSFTISPSLILIAHKLSACVTTEEVIADETNGSITGGQENEVL
jgi:hypothetical protein